ncbi:hypothetical protein [Paenibacillus sinopodophylli]|uniref:hypothetical protein n=1 Tax=Paenibacillus sinopodophylli TaxID=1837342 RepID=UPI00148616B4|nr:hypothetical protein [Paenibacillus sinopodophylli]
MSQTKSSTDTSYRTGEIVKHAGYYLSESGKKNKLQEGERFPACPISGHETTWSHAH